MHCLKDPALPLLHFNEVFAVVQASCWGCSPDDVFVPVPKSATYFNGAIQILVLVLQRSLLLP